MPTAPRLSLHPRHPERICWGCPRYCPADALACGNGSIRAPHPIELFGSDWLDFELDARQDGPDAGDDPSDPPDGQPNAPR